MVFKKQINPASGRNIALIALAISLLFLLLNAVQGFKTLHSGDGDMDSLLRLVTLRDLLAGQGWFDPQQYRMGLEGGFTLHWSRLVDAPLVVLILAAKALGASSDMAEHFAMTIWPIMLFGFSLAMILQIANRLAGPAAILPATVLGFATLYLIGSFMPGSIDHHNFQLALTLAMVNGLTMQSTRLLPYFLAGSATSLMLAIGMETAPYAAMGGLCAALIYLKQGAQEKQTAIGFGLGFGTIALAAYVTTISPASWLLATCDAFSLPQLLIAAIGGFGLAAIAGFTPDDSPTRIRLAWLGVLALVVAAVLVLLFPQCLGDPYANVDPKVKTYWLDHVVEAQSFFDLLRNQPAMLIAYFGPALLACLVLWQRMRESGPDRIGAVLGGVLLLAILVTIWQIRGTVFLLPFSAIILSSWVAKARTRAELEPTARNSLIMIASWILSFSASWSLIANGVNLAAAAAQGKEAQSFVIAPENACYRPQDMAQLAKLAPSRIMTISNLGSPILTYTHHSTLSGPYHRNIPGNLLAINILLAQPEEARQLLHDNGINLVVWCPGNPESHSYASWAQGGFATMLQQGKSPDWLRRVEASEEKVSDNGKADAGLSDEDDLVVYEFIDH